MDIIPIHPPRLVIFNYTNHRGIYKEARRAVAHGLSYGTTQWHSTPQWLLHTYDLDKNGDRTFAMAAMTEVRDAA